MACDNQLAISLGRVSAGLGVRSWDVVARQITTVGFAWSSNVAPQSIWTPKAPFSWLLLDSCLVEAGDEAWFAGVGVAECLAALEVGVVVVVAFGQRLQIGEQGDGVVVFAGFLGVDHELDAGPGRFLVAGKVVESAFAGFGTGLCAAGLLGGALVCLVAFAVCAIAGGCVEQVGDGSPGRGREGGGVLVAVAAQQLRAG